MKVTVTIEDEIADISGLVGALAGYFGGTKPSPWTNVPPNYPPWAVRTNDHPADDPKYQTPSNADVSPSHTWEIKNAKPHPPRGED